MGLTAREVFNYLIDHANARRDLTCDVLITGEPDRVVTKAATCFKLTAEVADRAAADGVDLIITHEPTFSRGDSEPMATAADRKKWERLQESGITVYRFHDHAHDSAPDYIHAGFIEAMGLQIKHKYPNESLGIARYELENPTTVGKLAADAAEKLGLGLVRLVGQKDCPVRTVCLALGGIGLSQVEYLVNPGCDLLITGEIDEVISCEYLRDVCYYGGQKAMLMLGHCGSEYAGMRLLAEKMTETLLPTQYFHCGEVFSRV